MLIRQFQPGDESAQVQIYNTAAASLPAFKPASSDEVVRRFQIIDFAPQSMFYAIDGDQVVGYAGFSLNGRISYPWCLPGFETSQEPLLSAVLERLKARGGSEAWAAYRADWSPMHSFFRERGFEMVREMINFSAETTSLPSVPLSAEMTVELLSRQDLPRLMGLGGNLFEDKEINQLERFFWENPFLRVDDFYALRTEQGKGPIVGAALVVIDRRYADPAKLDASMPCFRLGAFGTEQERHKRVCGMVSCLFTEENIGTMLVAEAARRLQAAGIAHAATQVSSERPDLLNLYDRFFHRQGSFPILGRRLI